MKYIYDFILIAILLLIGALTAASETSIIAASIIKLKRLSQEGSKTAKIILNILEVPERFFGTILVANNIVDALIASLLTVIIISFLNDRGKGILFATILATFLIIVFEVTAKTIAAKNPLKISLVLARMVNGLIFVLSPIVNVLSWITNSILSLIGIKTPGRLPLVIEEEIKALIKIGEEETLYHKDKYKMLAKVFEFSKSIVKSVMTAKDEIVSIDKNANIDELLQKALEAGYSRLPVYENNPENIVGVVNMKDLLNMSINRDLIILEDIIYPATFVQESKKVAELLKEFQKGHTHLAIVVDNKGKMQGLVTLEDILEEIVGEIEDEHDVRT